jgi:hypothetical protein
MFWSVPSSLPVILFIQIYMVTPFGYCGATKVICHMGKINNVSKNAAAIKNRIFGKAFIFKMMNDE